MASTDTPASDGSSLGGRRGAPLRRQQHRRFFLFTLLAAIFIFVAAAAALYFALRPETLRIAVGPSGSDDQKLIQALAQTFARQQKRGPACADPDRWRDAEPCAAAGIQDRSRGDASRSRHARRCAVGRHPAQERRRALGAVRPAGQGIQKNSSAEDQEPRRSRGAPHRRDRKNPGQRHRCSRSF